MGGSIACLQGGHYRYFTRHILLDLRHSAQVSLAQLSPAQRISAQLSSVRARVRDYVGWVKLGLGLGFSSDLKRPLL